MYHVELRQFPRNVCRYNMPEQELLAIVEPWARDDRVELGERSWDPRNARITVIEGPRVPEELLTMGRGWRHAQRHGKDVTARVLQAATARAAASRAHAGDTPGREASGSSRAQRDAAKGVGPERALDELLDLAALLGAEPRRLLAAWRSASARMPGRPPSECLAEAERELASRSHERGSSAPG